MKGWGQVMKQKKAVWEYLLFSYVEPVTNMKEYRKLKRWVWRARFLYMVVSPIATVMIIISNMQVLGDYPPLILAVALLCVGLATLALYIFPIFKSMFGAGVQGFEDGLNDKTTTYTVTHEYGNSYSVTSRTDDNGCLFAVMGGFFQFVLCWLLCISVAPFITFRKIHKATKRLKEYRKMRRGNR